MSCLKLEYYNNFEFFEKKDDSYVIDTIKKWIFLTKFNKSYLIINHPYGQVETEVDIKFIYNQNYILGCDLDFNYRYIFPLGNQKYKENTYPNTTVPFTGNFNGNFTVNPDDKINSQQNSVMDWLLWMNLEWHKFLVSSGSILEIGNPKELRLSFFE